MQPNAAGARDLDQLEAQSVFVIREAYNRIDRLAMLWSFGKDSNVLVWLVKKAFFGRVPFPAVNVDTGNKMPEVYAFRDRYAAEWGIDLRIVAAGTLDDTDPSLPPAARQGARKTIGLKRALAELQLDGVIAGIRRDEEGTRAKERYFSPRAADGGWSVAEQPPEFWDQFNTTFAPGTHVRVHPLLHWTELDIWRYIAREAIPVCELYFARNGQRYRSLGDRDITRPVASDAATIAAIVAELETTRVAERSGRSMDQAAEDAVERLRADGYM